MVFKMRPLAILVSYSVFLGLSRVHMLLYFCLIFLLLTCLMPVYLLDQPEEPKRVEETVFLPSNSNAEVTMGETGGRVYGISLYYFLQLHVNLHLSQSETFFDKSELNVTQSWMIF